MLRTLLRGAGIAYAIYLALCVLVLMPALNFLPHWFVKQQYGRELSSEIILFNPFTLALEARQVAMPERDGSPFASLAGARVDLSLESLWHSGWVFDRVALDQLYLHLRRLPDGTPNFADLLPADSGEEEPAEPGAIPGITIRDLRFQARQIRLTDESREQPFSTHFDDLGIAVQDLSTVLEDGKPYSVDAYDEDGGHLHWEGVVSVPGQFSAGKIALSDLGLRAAWRLMEPWLSFELTDGRLSLEGLYSLDWREGFVYRVSDGGLHLAELSIDPKQASDLTDTGVALPALDVTGIEIDGARQHLKIADVTVENLVATGWMEGERISLAELFAPPAAGQEPAAEPGSEEAGPSWTAELVTARLTGGRINWRSEFTAPARLTVAPIEAKVDNLRWPLQEETAVSLAVTVNETARASIEGALALATGKGGIDYALESVPLAWFNPNFPTALKAEITDGALTLGGRMEMDEFAPTHIRGGGNVTGFAGSIQGEEASVTSWETVRWEELEVDLAQRSVSLQRLLIDNYSGRLHIREDGTINTQKLWQEEVGEKAEELAEDLELDTAWTVSIPVIRVTDSQIDFMDESLPIRFRTVVGDLDGEVLGISTRPGQVAEVDIHGSVDGYAPVVLTGSAEPFTQPPALDLALTFDGVDMALLTPYSGTYAGYAIDRGLLNLDLRYSLHEGHLEGQNNVVINQLKLGAKVDSDKALDLPLELALALLTDLNGVIDLAVPVSGDLDNPEFGLGSVIAGAFVNLLTKAITAPFALLANLVGTEEDLQRINFASGSSELDEAARSKLVELNSALTQRPGITLVITGTLHPEADVRKLREQLLAAELVAEGIAPEQIEGKGPDWEQAIGKRYAALAPPDGAEATIGQQYRAVRDQVPVPEAELEALLQARAVAVKAFLVNEMGLAADRAVIDQISLDDEAQQFSGVELGLDT